MHSVTPTVVPTSGQKSGPQTYLAWLVAIITLPATVYFLVLLAGAVDREWGMLGVVVGLALFPVTLLLMPFYAGFVRGEWLLAGLLAALAMAAWLYAHLRSPSP
jgi:hypothetical protein